MRIRVGNKSVEVKDTPEKAMVVRLSGKRIRADIGPDYYAYREKKYVAILHEIVEENSNG